MGTIRRKRNWDYAGNCNYFVTIVTKNRTPWFGELSPQGELVKSYLGEIAEQQWLQMAKICPNISLGDFVIMPDHLHGIIHFQRIKTEYGPNQFGPQSHNLGSLIRGFKAATTHHGRKTEPYFKWQLNYHDVIIENEAQRKIFEEYIKDNPKQEAKRLRELHSKPKQT